MENLRALIDDALLSRKVATIHRCAGNIDLDDAQIPTFDPNDVVKGFSAGLYRHDLEACPHGRAALLCLIQTASTTPASYSIRVLRRQETHLLTLLENQGGLALQRVAAADAERSLARALWCLQKRHFLNLRKMPPQHFAYLREARIAADDVRRLPHEVSPIDSSEPQKLDIRAIDSDRLFDTGVAALSA